MLISINLDLLLNPACPPSTRRQVLEALSAWRSNALRECDIICLYDHNINQHQVDQLAADVEETGWGQQSWEFKNWQPMADSRASGEANQVLKLGLACWLGAKAHIEIATWPKRAAKSQLPQALFVVADSWQPSQLQAFILKYKKRVLAEKLAGYETIAISEQSIVAQLLKDAKNATESIQELPQRLLQLASKRSTKRRLSLAWVSPMPPDRTGIAEYADSLIPGLSTHYDLTVITDSNYQATNDGIKDIKNNGWFKVNGWRFDRICYHIGNSPYHKEICKNLKIWPGAVVMHEVRIGNLMYSFGGGGAQNRQWQQSLYQTHGYPGLMAAANESGPPIRTLQRYSCNGELIERALGMIVHSQHAMDLIRQDIRNEANLSTEIIPMCRAKRQLPSREQARTALGLDQDTILVCSFGMTGEAKMSSEIARAWRAAMQVITQKAQLSFVGSNDCGPYGEKLKSLLSSTDSSYSIEITGWVSDDIYSCYLSACDIAIQIRAVSRGETSAAIYDVLCAGIPTIANNHGSMADLPKEHTTFISANPSEAEIQLAIERVAASFGHEKERLKAIIPNLERRHSPAECANAYIHSLETIYSGKRAIENQLITDLASRISKAQISMEKASEAITRNFPRGQAKRQLLVDVSQIARSDYKTGIQRVVRSLVIELMKMDLKGFRVEPIWLSTAGTGWHYRYAREWTTSLLELPDSGLQDLSIEVGPGDILLLADLTGSYLLDANNSGIYQEMKDNGVDIAAIIYDILPLQLPDCFPPGSEETHRNWLKVVSTISSSLLCISQAVAQDTETWLRQQEPAIMGNLKIGWFHLGADLDNSSPTKGYPKGTDILNVYLDNRISFLMVGTVEPRKGYQQAVGAFELLLKQGLPYNLVIIGKQGWMMNNFVDHLRASKYHNNGIFWFDRASDEFLEWLYQRCNCLIAASEGEGFGLPLIEAARQNMPMLVRDLPVFREVAQDGAAYFSGRNPEDLATAICEWAECYQIGLHPDPRKLSWITWQNSATQIVNQLGLEITQ